MSTTTSPSPLGTERRRPGLRAYFEKSLFGCRRRVLPFYTGCPSPPLWTPPALTATPRSVTRRRRRRKAEEGPARTASGQSTPFILSKVKMCRNKRFSIRSHHSIGGASSKVVRLYDSLKRCKDKNRRKSSGGGGSGSVRREGFN